ncbi:MAG TPA: HigA family addiction module antitoxin [Stellaceae bacterium]|nr:HigA family addiction module antitoxin [Stellaceae bacterium]
MTIDRKDLDRGTVDLSEVVDAKAPAIAPTHPGEILREEFLDPLGITPYRLAKDISVPLTRVSAILAGERAITAETALRLGRYFGMTAEFWLGLQEQYDLDRARAELGDRLETEVKPRAA